MKRRCEFLGNISYDIPVEVRGVRNTGSINLLVRDFRSPEFDVIIPAKVMECGKYT